MDIDSISEKQARHILDILARKAGYHQACISKYGRLLMSDDYITLPIIIDDHDKDCVIISRQNQKCPDLCLRCLSRVLALSADSKDLVFWKPQGVCISKGIFLPKDTTLEQILIWLDLEGKSA